MFTNTPYRKFQHQSYASKVYGRAPCDPQAFTAAKVAGLTEDEMDQMTYIDCATQVIRKAPFGTTESDIIIALAAQIEEIAPGKHIAEVLVGVVRDGLDRRRFYITYKSKELKSSIAKKGFKIGNIQIPPEPHDVSAYIPDLPYFCTAACVRAILSEYGTVENEKFNTHQNTNIRVGGGFHFSSNLCEGQQLPKSIEVRGEVFHIIDKNSRMKCNYCDRYGHLRRACKKRIIDLERRAERE